MQSIDGTCAYKQVKSAATILKEMKKDSSCEFHQLFIERTQLGKQLHRDHFRLFTCKNVQRQAHQSNCAASSPEVHYWFTLYSVQNQTSSYFSSSVHHSWYHSKSFYTFCMSRVELTGKVQMQSIDVTCAYKQVKSAVTMLKKIKKDSLCEFHQLFIERTQLGKQLQWDHFKLSTPRIVHRQAHQSNPAMSSPEEHYWITLYNEFLSHVISQLQQTFVDNPAHSIALGLSCLLQSKCINLESGGTLPSELVQAAIIYTGDLPHSVMLSTMWVAKWKELHKTIADILKKVVHNVNSCSATEFPNLYVLLRLALIPITLCERKWSFSDLKLVQTDICSTITNDRLSWLALMKINKEYCSKP